MTTQTELLAALDRAIEELRASYLRFSNERDDEKTIATITALRDQIAKGCDGWLNTKYGTYFSLAEIAATPRNAAAIAKGELVKLYALTGADR